MHRRRRSKYHTWSPLGFARIFHCQCHTLPATYSGVASKTFLPWCCRRSSQAYPWDAKDPYGICQERHGMLLITLIINIGGQLLLFSERRHRCILVGFRFLGEEGHCRCFWYGGKGYREHRVHCLRRWIYFFLAIWTPELTWDFSCLRYGELIANWHGCGTFELTSNSL